MGETNKEEQKERKSIEDFDLVVEENTIYEVDFDCLECLKKERKNLIKDNSSYK